MPFSLVSGSRAQAVGGRSGAWRTAIVGLCLTLVAGCRSAPKPPSDASARAPTPYAVPEDDAVPPWLGDPLSWEKLERVESWLAGPGRHATPQWRNEAELTLNSGRLEFARRDLEAVSRGKPSSKNAPPAASKEAPQAAAVAARVRAAKLGFDRLVLRDDLNAGQRKRAQDGLARAERMLSPTAATAAKSSAALAVIPRATWGALKAKTAQMDRTVGDYSRITIHHSADNDPVVLDGSPARTYEAVRDIQRAHMNGKETHYGDIGYHFVIDPYGRILQGRELAYQGAHAMGDNNVRNIGICMIGNFDQEKPTEASLTALRRLIEAMRAQYGIDRDRVYNHRDLRSTRCPGENLARWVISYRGGAPAGVTVQAAVPRQAARTGR
jgi:hypothetical protein